MIYSYECQCGNIFDQVNSYENRNNAECTKCGSIHVQKLLSNPSKMTLGYLKDANGEMIWFPKDGKPYFDKALRRTFKTAKEKQKHMADNQIIMRGDKGVTKWPIESGDMRHRSYRRAMRWED